MNLITVHHNSKMLLLLLFKHRRGRCSTQLNSSQIKPILKNLMVGVLQFDQSIPFTPNTLPLDRWRSYAGPSLGSGEGAAMSIELQLAEGA